MKRICTGLTVLYLLLLTSCAGFLTDDATAPVIISVVEKLSMKQNSTIALTMEYIDAYDLNGDELSLSILDGENYSVDGESLTPTIDYLGLLYVPVQVVDSTGLASNIDTISIEVRNSVVEIQPLIDSKSWSYEDSLLTLDSTSVSRLYCRKDTLVPDKNLFTLFWDGSGVEYVYINTPLGLLQVGAWSAVDTLIAEQYKIKYPALVQQRWDFAPIRSKVNSGMLFQEPSTGMVVLDTASYITVPAGSYKVHTYSYSYTVPQQRELSLFEDGILPLPKDVRSGAQVEVRLYYAPSVGLVQSEISVNGILSFKKVLTGTTILGRHK